MRLRLIIACLLVAGLARAADTRAALTVQGLAAGVTVPVSQGAASQLNATVVGLGTAGTPSGGVLTIQGATSGTTGAAALSVQGGGAAGSALAGNPFLAAGTDGTNARTFEVASATTNTNATTTSVLRVATAANWSITHLPATATKATISKAAGGTTVRHVCTAFIIGFCAVGTAQTLITASVRDGATGAGTVLWSAPIVAPINGCVNITQSGLNLVGTANTAMTIEFSAAGVTSSQETVSLQGYSTP